MKTYNLKTEYNWRGDVAELLAKYMYGAKRTQGYDFRTDPTLSKKENAFLKRVWKRIDLYRCSEAGRLEIYEVKARTSGVTRKPDITGPSLAAYQQARAQHIPVHLVTVTFHGNWEISFAIEDFNIDKFRVNCGGRCRPPKLAA